MKLHTCTDQVVSDLVDSLLPQDSTARQKHVLNEALHSLVRLAKSEQILEMKDSVRRVTGPLVDSMSRARVRGNGVGTDGVWQHQFEFMRPELK